MKLYVDKKLNLDNPKINLLSEFCAFCAAQLPINGNFNVYVTSNRESHGISTTAAYEVNNNTCRIYGQNRALVDICRSIAHEMTHMMQDESGLLVGHIQDAGGFHEDQANARAGELIKRFAKSDISRKNIYESKI
jgi:hypothetical protein